MVGTEKSKYLFVIFITTIELTSCHGIGTALPKPTFTNRDGLIYLTTFRWGNSNYSETDPESKKNFRKSLEEFQVSHVNTGQLDASTVKIMKFPWCGVKDKPNGIVDALFEMPKFEVMNLTYKISKYPSSLQALGGKEGIDEEIQKAFDTWAMVTPFTFTPSTESFDIDISFVTKKNNDGRNVSFDGPTSTTAYASPLPGGAIYFNDEELLEETQGIHIFQIAAHQIGHVLGLGHSSVREAVMFPNYSGYLNKSQLHSNDIQRIQELYGFMNVTLSSIQRNGSRHKRNTPYRRLPQYTQQSSESSSQELDEPLTWRSSEEENSVEQQEWQYPRVTSELVLKPSSRAVGEQQRFAATPERRWDDPIVLMDMKPLQRQPTRMPRSFGVSDDSQQESGSLIRNNDRPVGQSVRGEISWRRAQAGHPTRRSSKLEQEQSESPMVPRVNVPAQRKQLGGLTTFQRRQYSAEISSDESELQKPSIQPARGQTSSGRSEGTEGAWVTSEDHTVGQHRQIVRRQPYQATEVLRKPSYASVDLQEPRLGLNDGPPQHSSTGGSYRQEASRSVVPQLDKSANGSSQRRGSTKESNRESYGPNSYITSSRNPHLSGLADGAFDRPSQEPQPKRFQIRGPQTRDWITKGDGIRGPRAKDETAYGTQVRGEQMHRPQEGHMQTYRTQEGNIQTNRPQAANGQTFRPQEGNIQTNRPQAANGQTYRPQEGNMKTYRTQAGNGQPYRPQEGNMKTYRTQAGNGQPYRPQAGNGQTNRPQVIDEQTYNPQAQVGLTDPSLKDGLTSWQPQSYGSQEADGDTHRSQVRDAQTYSPQTEAGPRGMPNTGGGPPGGPQTRNEQTYGPQIGIRPNGGPYLGRDGSRAGRGPTGGPQTRDGQSYGPNTRIGPQGGPNTAIGPQSGPNTGIGPQGGPNTGVGPQGRPNTGIGPQGGPHLGRGPQGISHAGGGPMGGPYLGRDGSRARRGPTGGPQTRDGQSYGPNTRIGPQGGPNTAIGPQSGPNTGIGPQGGPNTGVGPQGRPNTGIGPQGGPNPGRRLHGGTQGGTGPIEEPQPEMVPTSKPQPGGESTDDPTADPGLEPESSEEETEYYIDPPLPPSINIIINDESSWGRLAYQHPNWYGPFSRYLGVHYGDSIEEDDEMVAEESDEPADYEE